MTPPSIPGYYWNAEKKRFFKIEKNHLAIAESQYSSQSVKKLQEDAKKHDKAHNFLLQKRAQTVQRSPILSDFSLGGLRMREEHGTFASKAAVLDKRIEIWSKTSEFTKVGFAHGPAGCFDWDAKYQCFLYAKATPNLCEVELWLDIKDETPVLGVGMDLPKALLSSITSVSCSPFGVFAVATLAEDNTKGSIQVQPILSSHDPDDPPVIECFDQSDDESAWAVAANPHYPLFACGLTKKISILRPNAISDAMYGAPDGIQNLGEQHKVEESDVMSVEWLSANVVAYGQRTGKIHLFDLRSGGRTSRLWHPGMVRQLRCFDDSRIVAGGPGHALCMYDLRMPREDIYTDRISNTCKRKRPAVRSTIPLVQYPHGNASGNPGLAICPELGLLAAGSDDAPVAIWSLYHGQRLHKLSMPDNPDYDPKVSASTASHLKFSNFNDEYALFATYKGEIYKTRIGPKNGVEEEEVVSD